MPIYYSFESFDDHDPVTSPHYPVMVRFESHRVLVYATNRTPFVDPVCLVLSGLNLARPGDRQWFDWILAVSGRAYDDTFTFTFNRASPVVGWAALAEPRVARALELVDARVAQADQAWREVAIQLDGPVKRDLPGLPLGRLMSVAKRHRVRVTSSGLRLAQVRETGEQVAAYTLVDADAAGVMNMIYAAGWPDDLERFERDVAREATQAMLAAGSEPEVEPGMRFTDRIPRALAQFTDLAPAGDGATEDPPGAAAAAP